MNESVSLSGLAKQMVLAELLDEKAAQQAQQQAQRNKLSLVTYLVQNKLVKSRALAELAAEQFGVAFFDLNAIDKEGSPESLSARNWYANIACCRYGVEVTSCSLRFLTRPITRPSPMCSSAPA